MPHTIHKKEQMLECLRYLSMKLGDQGFQPYPCKTKHCNSCLASGEWCLFFSAGLTSKRYQFLGMRPEELTINWQSFNEPWWKWQCARNWYMMVGTTLNTLCVCSDVSVMHHNFETDCLYLSREHFKISKPTLTWFLCCPTWSAL